MNSFRNMVVVNTLVAVFIVVFLAANPAKGQSLRVAPVIVQLPAGQKTATLTVSNDGGSATTFQIRAYEWGQQDNKDPLTPTSEVLASPPVATIAPGDSQIVRLVLRQLPQGREATYRILLDQIPPAAEPGIVHMLLRLSIPIFAQPATRTLPHVQFHLEHAAGQLLLVGVNDGRRHDSFRDISLSTGDGLTLKPVAGTLPYILAGSTRRWVIATQQGAPPLTNVTLRMTAQADAGKFEQQIPVVEIP